MESLAKLIQKATEDGIITEAELRELHQHIMWDGHVTPAEKDMFKDLMRKIDRKELKVGEKPAASKQPPADSRHNVPRRGTTARIKLPPRA